MYLSEEQIVGLGTALNEANLLGLEVHPSRKIARATFAVLTLPETGDVPKDRRVQMIFQPIGRVVASLRHGVWNDTSAKIENIQITDLLAVVQSFSGSPLYGWDFFDVEGEKNFDKWSDRLSLDFRSDTWFERLMSKISKSRTGFGHTIDLFQESQKRHLDIRLWFDDLEIRNPDGGNLALDDFIAGGKRWWDGLSNKDERTKDFGIFPLSNDKNQKTLTQKTG